MVKMDVPERDNPVVPSVVDIWPTANFHEREAWDLMGVALRRASRPRRILMREDWVGHPLRKDYVDERPHAHAGHAGDVLRRPAPQQGTVTQAME